MAVIMKYYQRIQMRKEGLSAFVFIYLFLLPSPQRVYLTNRNIEKTTISISCIGSIYSRGGKEKFRSKYLGRIRKR